MEYANSYKQSEIVRNICDETKVYDFIDQLFSKKDLLKYNRYFRCFSIESATRTYLIIAMTYIKMKRDGENK
jgi:hypothetical protein